MFRRLAQRMTFFFLLLFPRQLANYAVAVLRARSRTIEINAIPLELENR